MNKEELVKEVAKKSKASQKVVASVVDATVESIEKATIQIAESTVPVFTAGKQFKELLLKK